MSSGLITLVVALCDFFGQDGVECFHDHCDLSFPLQYYCLTVTSAQQSPLVLLLFVICFYSSLIALILHS